MKTTLEIPGPLFRKVKISAAERGQTLKQFVTEAVEEKLERKAVGSPPWLKFFGILKGQSAELHRIDATIEEQFGRVDSEAWK